MQELLGRLGALDPEASQSLRVVACFDELMTGNVGVRGLMSAAAALAGRPVGLRRQQVDGVRVLGPDGRELGSSPVTENCYESEGLTVWIAASGKATVNDRIVLERLAIALQLRFGNGSISERRDLAKLVDETVSEPERVETALRCGLRRSIGYRVLVAPLFATWSRHAHGCEDVVPTEFGPVHVTVCEANIEAEGRPVGVSAPVGIGDLPAAFRAALVCLRLSSSAEPQICADDLGGLVEMLSRAPERGAPDRDETALLEFANEHSWTLPTVEALTRASTVREAARMAGVHHSTMTTRIDLLTGRLGYPPLEGLGRARFAVAVLRMRLRSSRVFELPPPS